MDITTGAMLAYFAMMIWLAAAAWADGYPRRLRQWMRVSGNRLTLSVTLGALLAFGVGVFGQFQDSTSRWREWSVELISVSFAVLVIDYANRRRAASELKQSIIRQMASRSNDFALDAARVVVDRGWHTDGSLKGAKFPVANLAGAHLERANLQGANLWRANLQGADLLSANLQSADLWSANFQGVDLWRADLRGAHMERADLQRANLERVYLQGADLLAADLRGADLRRANLQGAILDAARYNSATRWPEGFDPVAAGAILVEDAPALPP